MITLNYFPDSYSDPSSEMQYKLPMIGVSITHKGKNFRTTGLIDSGSTRTFIPKEFANIMDLDLTGQTDIMVGANGSFKSTKSVIGRCFLRKGENQIFENFINLHVNVPVNTNTLPCMVFGRDSIFQKFNITFQEKNEKIILKRVR